MKTYLAFIIILLDAALTLNSATLLSDGFAYPTGPIVSNSGAKWTTHSGNTNQVDVAEGRLNLDGTETEDVNTLIPGGPYTTNAAVTLYASFKLTCAGLPSPGGSYFAHFKDGSTGFRGRIWSQTTGAAAGTFRLGISSVTSSAANAASPDLKTNTEYQVVLRLNVTTGQAALWINPAAETDPSLTSDSGSSINVTAFAFRQSTGIGVLRIDDLIVGTAFADVLGGGCSAPSFITQPKAEQTVSLGDTLVLEPVVTGSSPLSYQWSREGTNLPNATNLILSLPAVTQAQAGSYTLTATNSCGSATSQAAKVAVSVTNFLPVVTVSPTVLDLDAGNNARFNTSVSGPGPYTFQWRFGSSDLANETNASLVLPNVGVTDSGGYRVLVSNPIGSTLSQEVRLNVSPRAGSTSTNIAFLRTLVDNVNYLPTDTSNLYTVEGVVTTSANLTGLPNVLFYMQDETAGIAVFWAAGAGQFVPTAGDRVRVTAPLAHFNGLLELSPVLSNPKHSVVLISGGNTLPAPKPLIFSQQDDPAVIEQLEGSYVIAKDVLFDLSTPTFGSGKSIPITNPAGETFILFVNAQTDLVGQPRPISTATVVGVLAQFDSSNPRTGGYQIIPSKLAEISSASTAATFRFTNQLELVRAGDLPTNTFTELVLLPGEKLTTRFITSDQAGRPVSLKPDTTALPATASWQIPLLTGTNLSGVLVFAPSGADAGKLHRFTLVADNGDVPNNATWTVYVPTAAEAGVVLTEVMANPATDPTSPLSNPLKRAGASKNPNSDDEYVELANLGAGAIDLVGWTIGDSVQVRHKFYENFSVGASNVVVVYGGPLNGFTPQLNCLLIPASEDVFGFGLNNTGGDSVIVRNAQGNLLSRAVFPSVPAGASLTRFPGYNSPFVPHSSISNDSFSPGLQWNLQPFNEPVLEAHPPFEVGVRRNNGRVVLTWIGRDGYTYSVMAASQPSGPYTAITNGITSVNGEAQFSEAASHAVRFYQIKTP